MITLLALILGLNSSLAQAPLGTNPPAAAERQDQSKVASVGPEKVKVLMERIKGRIQKLKYNWDLSLFSDEGWTIGGTSVDGMPLIYWKCGEQNGHENASLVLSAVHGDEVTPVYFGFRLVEWLKARPEVCKDRFIVVAPIVNPDGFLRYTSGTRTNFNKVDLNRNFQTPEWAKQARQVWKTRYKAMRRYYPGEKPSSEPETLFQEWLISHYKPVKILSVHAPLNILDYDGPQDDKATSFMQSYIESCDLLKNAIKKATPKLRFFAFGNFPGSLGNYAGRQRGIPVITTELPSIRAEKAAEYFATMESGTKTFFEFDIKDSPIRSASKESPTPSQN